MSKVISAKNVKLLRERTGAGVLEAKGALTESGGDIEKAILILRKKGALKAVKKADRSTGSGLVDTYIHGEGRIGVIVEVNCETDFVARNSDFKSLVHDIALQIAAMNPLYISSDEVPQEIITKEKEIFLESAKGEGKPPAIAEKIAEGKLNKFYQETCLLDQPFVKDQNLTIRELIHGKIAVIGENIRIKRFVRYVLGE